MKNVQNKRQYRLWCCESGIQLSYRCTRSVPDTAFLNCSSVSEHSELCQQRFQVHSELTQSGWIFIVSSQYCDHKQVWMYVWETSALFVFSRILVLGIFYVLTHHEADVTVKAFKVVRKKVSSNKNGSTCEFAFFQSTRSQKIFRCHFALKRARRSLHLDWNFHSAR